jgi:DNA-binding transcriptional MerR regulator
MDTNEVAEAIGTNARTLRQFLRSGTSTYVAVGSGARYDFTEADLPTLTKRFSEWKGGGKPSTTAKKKTQRKSKAEIQRTRDEAEWEDEGMVELQDIRDPRVRRRVLADAAAAEARLEVLLMARGLHVTQLGDR